MGELGRVRLPLRPLVVGIVAVLVASTSVVWSAGTALAAPPTPAPDPAPVSTTTTQAKTTTTRTTTTPKPAVAPRVRTRTTTHTTATTPKPATKPVSKPAVKHAVKPVKKPVVKAKPRVTHTPKPSSPKQRPTTKPVVQPAPAVPTAAVLGETSSSGGKVGHTLLIVAALALLAISLVPTRFVVTHAGIEPARAAAIKTGFAVTGLSVGVGFLISLLLSKTP